MTDVRSALQGLRSALIDRRRRIMDATFIRGLDFDIVEDLSSYNFTVKACWEDGQFTKTYKAETAVTRGRRGYKYRKTFCAFADDLIKDILRARGIVK
jgi:hypothetical protein